MADPLFRFDDAGDYRRVRDVLAAAGYDDAGVSEALASGPTGSLTGKKLPLLLRRVRGDSPLEVLIRLFVLGVAVERKAAAGAIDPDWWAERGLVRITGGQVEATVQLRCYQGLIVAFDFRGRGGQTMAADFVMGIGASSVTLAGLTVRKPSRRTLDLGTGSGFQAFLAARHSERVIATDRNPRAVEMATFNARVNGLDHIECREGDLFGPVAGEKFDLIVSNPPFIVSPDNIYYFLHSGLSGDEICRTIARQAGGYLNEGGYCQFLANWTVVEGQDWRDRLAEWFEGTGCDAWVLRRGSQAPDEYASIWIETGDADEASFAASFNAWMDYYGRLGVEAIDSGLVTMRRCAAGAGGGDGRAPWFRADDSPDTMTFPAGEEVRRGFELQDFLARADDVALLATRFGLADDVRLDQQYRPNGTDWEAVGSQLRRVQGLHWTGGIDPYGLGVLARCDGTRTMAELLDELAASLGDDAVDDRPRWAAIVRRLTERGFLLPARAGAGSRSSPP